MVNIISKKIVDKNFVDNLLSKSLNEGIEKSVVGAIIKDGEKFLLLKRPVDDFMGGINELPSGNLEKDEDLVSALNREVKEETDLDIEKIVKYLGHFDYLSCSGKKARQFNFLVIAKPGQIKLTEHDGYVWATSEDKEFDKVTDNVRKILDLA